MREVEESNVLKGKSRYWVVSKHTSIILSRNKRVEVVFEVGVSDSGCSVGEEIDICIRVG